MWISSTQLGTQLLFSPQFLSLGRQEPQHQSGFRMNLREWRGMGTGSSRRADICYYTYIWYTYSIYLYGWSINFLQLLPTCDICHCISIAGGTFQLHETVLTIVSLKTCLTTKDIRDIILRSIASPCSGYLWCRQERLFGQSLRFGLAVQTTMAPVTSSSRYLIHLTNHDTIAVVTMYLMNHLQYICHNFMFHESSGSPFAMLLGDGRCITRCLSAPPGYGGNLGCFVSFRTSWHFGRSGGQPGLVVVKKIWYIWYLGSINYIQTPEALRCGQIVEVINARPLRGSVSILWVLTSQTSKERAPKSIGSFDRPPGGPFLRHHGRSQSGSCWFYGVPQLCGSSCAGEARWMMTFHGNCGKNQMNWWWWLLHVAESCSESDTVMDFKSLGSCVVRFHEIFCSYSHPVAGTHKGLAKDGISAPLKMCLTV